MFLPLADFQIARKINVQDFFLISFPHKPYFLWEDNVCSHRGRLTQCGLAVVPI